ncbi:MAG: hypothetical protein UY82_C0026G0008 [Candidatus Uhrbacteria bacterium GW2011_GWC2_53_7]|uniref:Uncharacterized protein n=1 Tax=Candidatus Uhrbacteria bacterium GW2011_GWC2_53_7 TaxID=1618986 RepID=A0A0G1XZ05_9BACT|nr:MAG: hypothetical protein UY82_C0026G0008 [Candidatus Uhrbacteria bacterium GW2011_GWC2_53_7]
MNPGVSSVVRSDNELQTFLDSEDSDDLDDLQDWNVYTKRPGYQGIQVCAPNGEDCSCTYQKVTYGTGIKTKYYWRDMDSGEFLTGVCLGGELEGMECETDEICNAEEGVAIGRCVKPTSVETMLGVDGYCLERDSAINKWKDPNKTFGGECLTWLPVDQLTGSNDIYNQSTEAGALLDQDVLYCTETALYADLYVTGSQSPGQENNEIANGCAESRSGGGACSTGEYEECYENAHCPKNYFAVLGSCDLTLNAPAYNCVTGNGDQDGSDDDCPFFCVPDEAVDYTGGGADCSSPEGGTNSVDTGEGWETTVYRIGGNFQDALENYRHCARFGAKVPDDYQRMYYLTDSSPQFGYFQANNDIPYLACEEVVQVSDTDAGNKGWTNRLWLENNAFSLQNTESPNHLTYEAATEPIAPYGRVDMGILEKTTDGDWERVGPQKAPVAVESCVSNVSGNYTAALADSSCVSAPVDGEARSYEALSAVVSNELSAFPECSNVGGNAECNGDANCRPQGNAGCFKRCDSTGSESNTVPAIGCWYDPDQDGDAYTSLGNCVTLASTNIAMDEDAPDGDVKVCEIPVSVDNCAADDDAVGVPATSTVSEYLGRIPKLYCQGGDWGDGDVRNAKAWCIADYACFDQLCLGTAGQKRCIPNSFTGDAILEEIPSTETSSNDDSVTPMEAVRQIFAKVFGFFTFDPIVQKYNVSERNIDSDVSESPDDYNFPIPDPPGGGTAPVVRGLDDCFSSGCREAGDDTVTVNGVTGGTILGDFGAAHVSVQFFAEANANQLPIRNVIVNFGDGHQSGSTSPANYYKNRRGLDQNNNDTSFCNENTKWGETPQSCEPNYFTFTHDYICTTQLVSEGGLPLCSGSGDLSDGCRTSDGLCQFIPRVHVKDNWGYCTGECGTATESPAGTECYDDTSGDAGWEVNECELECDGEINPVCPASTLPLFSGQTINPWIEFDGVVRVEP